MRITRIALVWLVLGSLAAPVSAQRNQRGQQGWIGISIDIRADEGRARREASVVIGEVRSGSPAAEAGLRAGDRLVAIGDLRGADDFRNLPERLRLSVGERVRIRIERDGRRRDVVVRAAERPGDLRSRTVLLPMQPDSMVEVMMRAMDSLRVHLTEVRQNVQRDAETSGRLRVVRQDSQTSFGAPFEFFVFRGEQHDSLRRAMEDLNRTSDELRRQEQRRIQELRGVTARRGNVQELDEELQNLRSELEGVTRQSARLRTAMSEAARVTAGFDYALPAAPQTPRA
ncbi:MAG: PDZ domain-containing protein, partial [Gemmatimonadota bacterium]|nr:PDZ domain-containing protein [Gemmatimonadota bacterium]